MSILYSCTAAADADNLVLTSLNFTLSTGAANQEVPVELGLLSVEAAFGELAWAGMYYPRPQRSTSTVIIHAQIVGAQVTWVYCANRREGEQQLQRLR